MRTSVEKSRVEKARAALAVAGDEDEINERVGGWLDGHDVTDGEGIEDAEMDFYFPREQGAVPLEEETT